VAKGKERYTLRGHKAATEFVAITPDGKTVVSADQRGGIKVWDLTTGRERMTLKGVADRPDFLFLSADGRTLTIGWHDVEQWALATGRELATLKSDDTAGGAAVSPDGKLLARTEHGARPATVRLFDLPSGRPRAAWQQSDGSAEPLAFSPD